MSNLRTILLILLLPLCFNTKANPLPPILSLLLIDEDSSSINLCQPLSIPRPVRGIHIIASGCYKVSDSISVVGTLIIEPGTELRFTENTTLRIEANGILKAVGRASEPILMTGAEKTRGYWKGVTIVSSAVISELKHLTIEYAGTQINSCDSSLCIRGLTPYNARVKISDITIQHGKYAGFKIFSNATIVQFDNVVSKNNLLPGTVHGRNLHVLNKTNQFVGNDNNHIHVERDQIVSDATWNKLDVAYHLESQSILRALTIEPGTLLRIFPEERLIVTGPSASLSAMGTIDQPIIFTAVDPSLPWRSIGFDGQSHQLNQLENVVIRYGGFGHTRTFPRGNIEFFCSSSKPTFVSLKNSHITNSVGWGIVAEHPACDLDQVNNFFNENQSGNICLPGDCS